MNKLITMDAGEGRTVEFRDRLPSMDDGLAFYISQLSSVEKRIYEAKYTNINFQELVPVDTSDPEYVDTVSYISYDAVTMGKFIGSNGKDLPQVDIDASISHVPVGYGGLSYGYSLDELRKSQAQRIPLDVTKAKMANRGHQEHAQRVAYSGDADRGMGGLFNNANVSTDNSTTTWSSASGFEIVADCNAALNTPWINSENVHLPNVLVLPSDRFAYISGTRMDSGTDTTILEYLKANNVYTATTGQELRIVPRLQLQDASANGRIMAYELNDENLTMKMPMPFRSLPPQAEALRINVPCEYKFGGVEFRYPGCAHYRDMIAF